MRSVMTIPAMLHLSSRVKPSHVSMWRCNSWSMAIARRSPRLTQCRFGSRRRAAWQAPRCQPAPMPRHGFSSRECVAPAALVADLDPIVADAHALLGDEAKRERIGLVLG